MSARYSLPSCFFTPLAKRMLLAGTLGLTVIATTSSTPSQDHQPVQDGKDRTITCVFVNPGYSGSCTESTQAPSRQPAPEACEPILTCLNNPQCMKTYCGATTVRSGWTLESANDSQSSRSSTFKR
jgi:hypothetical protein